jgi:hypothetical protein
MSRKLEPIHIRGNVMNKSNKNPICMLRLVDYLNKIIYCEEIITAIKILLSMSHQGAV